MSAPGWRIRRAERLERAELEGLAALMLDCVEGGASIGFLAPLAPARALAFWERVARELAAGERALLLAEDELGICGTVQLVLALPENQPHRADLVKMLVHRRKRRCGLGAALLRSVEELALACGRSLLVLDAVTGADGARLYERHGFTRVGDVPNFALYPDGRPCGTTYYYRALSRETGRRVRPAGSPP